MWTASWELFDAPPEVYAIEIAAIDMDGKVVTSRKEKFLHGSNGKSNGRSR
jgi:hypothetical protein